MVLGDLTDAATLTDAVVDAVVFMHGPHGGAAEAEAVDYGAVRNVLAALGPQRPRIALKSEVEPSRLTPLTKVEVKARVRTLHV